MLLAFFLKLGKLFSAWQVTESGLLLAAWLSIDEVDDELLQTGTVSTVYSHIRAGLVAKCSDRRVFRPYETCMNRFRIDSFD